MIVELKPIYVNQKSFYGKAMIEAYNNILILYSYNVKICKITNGKFYRVFNSYSATTMRHVNEFRMQNGFSKLSKKEWLKLEVEV
mgnify:CR=1 FL=1